jgi:hypothetical protein
VLDIEGLVNDDTPIRMIERLDAAWPAVAQPALDLGLRKEMNFGQHGRSRVGRNEPDRREQLDHQGYQGRLIHGDSLTTLPRLALHQPGAWFVNRRSALAMH